MVSKRLAVFGLGILVSSASLVISTQAQQISDLDRQRAQQMLKTVSDEVRKHYYDPKFHAATIK